jgi:hypothetical protein
MNLYMYIMFLWNMLYCQLQVVFLKICNRHRSSIKDRYIPHAVNWWQWSVIDMSIVNSIFKFAVEIINESQGLYFFWYRLNLPTFLKLLIPYFWSSWFSGNVLTPTREVIGSNLCKEIGYTEIFLLFLSPPRHFGTIPLLTRGTRQRSWLRSYSASRKVAGLIPDEVIVFFSLLNLSSRIMCPEVDSASDRNEYQESS